MLVCADLLCCMSSCDWSGSNMWSAKNWWLFNLLIWHNDHLKNILLSSTALLHASFYEDANVSYDFLKLTIASAFCANCRASLKTPHVLWTTPWALSGADWSSSAVTRTTTGGPSCQVRSGWTTGPWVSGQEGSAGEVSHFQLMTNTRLIQTLVHLSALVNELIHNWATALQYNCI